MLNATSEIASVIGGLASKNDSVSSNISPDDVFGLLNQLNTDFLQGSGSVTVTGLGYGSTSFVLDHPVYGELDSSTLSLDGGYTGSSSVLYTETF